MATATGMGLAGAAMGAEASHAPAAIRVVASASLSGKITSSGSEGIGIDGRVYALAPTVRIQSRGYRLPLDQLKSGMRVNVRRSGGKVTGISALGAGTNLPASHQIRGRIAVVTPTTLTIGGYTVSVAPNVDLDIHAHVLTQTLAPGLWVHVWLNVHGQVDSVVAKPKP